ncbi:MULTISPECIES: cardiolipin synthase [Deefgea]|uniref:Cardiolipin synthase n=1 Tax=Deefgea chitinilytica TaxID=570276 RepID=A0ABS2CFJ3_9NEIS|nr:MULTISPECIES: cardiolipin synthase [Deefgea]MBM5572926.1 cardiolipin synthase [Deefgea chitinilytica]MBM9890162.1 cardiolipin synthase [Deefgea sp. CFH1-16]
MSLYSVLPIILLLIQLMFIVRAILRPQREPASRVAWIVVIALLPGLGVMAYILLGETSIGRRRVTRLNQAKSALQSATVTPWPEQIPERFSQLFQFGQSVNGFAPVAGNTGQLLPADGMIAAMVADMDAATEHIHLIFYIWLTDHSGLQVVEALKRAAARGVACRAMADCLGSRGMIASPHWQAMQDAGVQVAVALPIGNPLLRPFHGRIDLRNHRKIVVIDRSITYCGSQNCADAEFLVKAKYAPWVDAVMRFTGPIAQQNHFLFKSDWMAQTGDDLTDYLPPIANTHIGQGVVAQVIGTGPTQPYAAMPEMFTTLMFAARRELVITTPYFVPDEAMQAALCATARRGVSTTVIFPQRNDSWIVEAASHSYYEELLAAGVQIYEFVGGVLHTKSLTLDGEMTLIGSANLDRRSFELNFENNILFFDAALTQEMRQRQREYLEHSQLVTLEMVAQWPVHRRLWNNTIAMLGPLL